MPSCAVMMGSLFLVTWFYIFYSSHGNGSLFFWWSAMSPHIKQGSCFKTQHRPFLCGVCTFFPCLHVFSRSTPASSPVNRLTGDIKLPIGVNCCLSLCVSPVNWRLVQGITYLPPNASRHQLQHPTTPVTIAVTENCLRKKNNA